MPASERFDGCYVLPLRWDDDAGLEALTDYLARLARWLPVIVVDGSAAELYREHRRRWTGLVDHCRPDPWPGRNGKVAGVMTGVRRASTDRVIIADDDVRFGVLQLRRVLELLDVADLVRPQNYFVPLPWHARWDTARTLINRALGSDYPGTFGVRRSTLLRAGGYDGDVLFENLELIRTIRRAGGRELRSADLFVARAPPTVRHFARQRVRQAYDSFAQPLRLGFELALLPSIAWATRRPRAGAWLVGCTLALAEVGRRRGAGRSVFPASTTLFAPVWTLERAVCAWIAVGRRMTGGMPYAGGTLPLAATPRLRGARRRSRTPRSCGCRRSRA